jgi:general secretion pathway protein H
MRLDVEGSDMPAGQARGDGDMPPVPAVWFDPAGLTEPFSLRLSAAGGRVELAWNAGGTVIRREEAVR